jgi:hypothetical protein
MSIVCLLEERGPVLGFQYSSGINGSKHVKNTLLLALFSFIPTEQPIAGSNNGYAFRNIE